MARPGSYGVLAPPPPGGYSLVCPEALEETSTVFLRVLVNPHHESTLSPLLAQEPDGGNVEHIGAGVAAHGLQPLQHVFRDPHRLAFTHPSNSLRQKPSLSPPFIPCPQSFPQGRWVNYRGCAVPKEEADE